VKTHSSAKYLGVKKIMSSELNPYWNPKWSWFDPPSAINNIYNIDMKEDKNTVLIHDSLVTNNQRVIKISLG